MELSFNKRNYNGFFSVVRFIRTFSRFFFFFIPHTPLARFPRKAWHECMPESILETTVQLIERDEK